MRCHAVNYKHIKHGVAKARGNDIPVHFKHAREIAHALRHMHVKRAKRLLIHVMQHKEAIPFTRYKYGIGHNAQGKEWGTAQTGFPLKASKVFLELIRNCENNARKNNVNPKKCRLTHIMVNKARVRGRRTYRAHGRIGHFNRSPCHIEIVMTERGKPIAKAIMRKQKRRHYYKAK